MQPQERIKAIISDDERRWNTLRRSVIAHNSVQAFNMFKENGIDCLIIKGVSASRHYPQHILRDSIDIDIAVDPANSAAAYKIVLSRPHDGLAIDLHIGLRHLGEKDWLNVFDHSEILALKEGSIRVLCPEYNLRTLSHHWLIDGGRDKNRLWDLHYLVEDTRLTFNWDLFIKDQSDNYLTRYRYALGITSRVTGLDLSQTPFADAKEKLPDWIVDYLEKTWQKETRHLPMESSIFVKGETLRQFKDRLNPNPIRAIIEMNGDLNTPFRYLYQLANFLYRIPSTLKRVFVTIRSK